MEKQLKLKRKWFNNQRCNQEVIKRFWACKILTKLSSNAYFIELPTELQIIPIHIVCDLFPFGGFDGEAAEVQRKWFNYQRCNKML